MKVREFDNGEKIITFKCITDEKGIDEVDFSFNVPSVSFAKKFMNIAVDSEENNVNISKEDAIALSKEILEFFKDTL